MAWKLPARRLYVDKIVNKFMDNINNNDYYLTLMIIT